MSTAQSGAEKRSKIDIKREQIMQERMQRHLNAGLSPEQAYRRIQEEDWQRLNPHDKASHVRDMLVGNIQKIAGDITLLHDNQKGLANTMDVNFRAFEKVLGMLGISTEVLEKVLEECAQEVLAERQTAPQTEEERKEAIVASVDEAGPRQVPEGATVFGG